MTNDLSSNSRVRRVGFIGMGIMGAPMARNLLKAGFEVTVWNRTIAKCEPLKQTGALVANSPADLARKIEVICICVTDTPDVEQVVLGPEGIMEGAQAGLIVIDHSTISPGATQELAKKLAEQEVSLLDAPVSGGDTGAVAGTLSIMVGGPTKAFEQSLPVLQAMGKNITHVGGSGMGQVCKACNQVAGMCALLGVCEAMALAKKSGLALDKMIEVVSAGAAGSWQLANLGPKIAKGDYSPGFMIDLVLKDLAIVVQTARDLKLPMAATALVESYFRRAVAEGAGRLGTQAIAKVVEQLGMFRYSG